MSLWTPHDVLRLRSLHASANYSDETAAKLLGRTPRGVAIKRHTLNLVASRCRSRIKSASDYELATELRSRGFIVTARDEGPSHSGVCTL